MSEQDELTLIELSEESGVPERKLRYYMAKGILPPAPRSGPGVRYPRAHLTRLKLVQWWQDSGLGLDQIRKQLADLNDKEVERLFQTQDLSLMRRHETRGSAADYVRQALGKGADHAPPPVQLLLTRPTRDASPSSYWERLEVDEDVEIHVRRPLSPAKTRSVEALLQEARRLLKEPSR
jgi:DNA-binding transcriptional MerR regulator